MLVGRHRKPLYIKDGRELSNETEIYKTGGDSHHQNGPQSKILCDRVNSARTGQQMLSSTIAP